MQKRKSPRASRYDYSSYGTYFITTCTKNRKHIFGYGFPGSGLITLNQIGKICEQEIQTMIQKRPSITIHEYIIMPNHIHFLITIHPHSNSNSHSHSNFRTDVGLPRPCPLNPPSNIYNQSLGSIIGGFKSAVSRKCNQLGLHFSRQTRYHDHIVRDYYSYKNIKHYIQQNPIKRTLHNRSN